MSSVTVSQGSIPYREAGSGEPIVFVHGAFVDGRLWRKVVPGLERDFRCILPDLPLGAHSEPMSPDADLSPPGLARLVAEFLEALDLRNVTLVGNDTGGAICQLVATEHPERIGRLVLTNCDAFENFLPPAFRYLQLAARIPGAVFALTQPLRLRALRRTPLTFGWLSKRPVEKELSDSWLRPLLSSRPVRRDTAKLLRGISKRYTLEAATKLASFDRPALIAWAPEDKFFPVDHAERLATIIPDAHLERIDDSYTFVSEDQPERLAELIAAFARRPRAAETARAG
jgi:pimeloyl-ACP methyl ester carboxylesterase